MCWFLTIAVTNAQRPALEARFSAIRDLQAAWLASSPTAKVFTAGSCCVEISQGGCSCSLYAVPAAPGQAEKELERRRHSLKLKGWSSAKIERALAAKSESEARPGPNRGAAEAFKVFIAGVAEELGEVNLFAHFYRGSQSEEDVGSPDRISISVTQFLEAGFPPDTIVSVRRAAG